ncbi:hypothetical protein ACLKA7_002886 [Drosophila subpalustris]
MWAGRRMSLARFNGSIRLWQLVRRVKPQKHLQPLMLAQTQHSALLQVTCNDVNGSVCQTHDKLCLLCWRIDNDVVNAEEVHGLGQRIGGRVYVAAVGLALMLTRCNTTCNRPRR